MTQRSPSPRTNITFDRVIRNLILVGPSQHGKSTLANYLTFGRKLSIQDMKFKTGDGTHSCTSIPSFSVIRHSYPISATTIKMIIACIVDTPGLQDTESKDEDVLRGLINFIDKYSSEGVCGICVVVKYGIPLTQAFYETIKFYSKLFEPIFKSNSYIIMTKYPVSKAAMEQEIDEGRNPQAIFDTVVTDINKFLGMNLTGIQMESLPRDEQSVQLGSAKRNMIISSLSDSNVLPFIATRVPKLMSWVDEDLKESKMLEGQKTGIKQGIHLAREANTEILTEMNSLIQNKDLLGKSLIQHTRALATLTEGLHLLMELKFEDDWHMFSSSSKPFDIQSEFPISSVSVSGGYLVYDKDETTRKTGLVKNGWLYSMSAIIKVWIEKRTYNNQRIIALTAKITETTEAIVRIDIQYAKLTGRDSTMKDKIKELEDLLNDINKRVDDLEDNMVSLNYARSRLSVEKMESVRIDINSVIAETRFA
jgi:cell division protein FtsB